MLWGSHEPKPRSDPDQVGRVTELIRQKNTMVIDQAGRNGPNLLAPVECDEVFLDGGLGNGSQGCRNRTELTEPSIVGIEVYAFAYRKTKALLLLAIEAL